MSSTPHRTPSTCAATQRARANPTPVGGGSRHWLGRGAALPLNPGSVLETQLNAATGCDGAYCGVTTCGATTSHLDGATSWSPTTTLHFRASPSASPSASSSASPSASACPMSRFAADPIPRPSNSNSNSMRFSANNREPLPAFPCESSVESGAATSGTTAVADVALQDWMKEAASMVQNTAAAPRVLGQKQRQRLMQQWFDDAPQKLLSPAFPQVNRASQVNQVNAVNTIYAQTRGGASGGGADAAEIAACKSIWKAAFQDALRLAPFIWQEHEQQHKQQV
ncbi:unnamed protein product [Closterium sp. Naga37s-1]|nr:unnamed protein product [Closterium sp. Naga37s-1]